MLWVIDDGSYPLQGLENIKLDKLKKYLLQDWKLTVGPHSKHMKVLSLLKL